LRRAPARLHRPPPARDRPPHPPRLRCPRDPFRQLAHRPEPPAHGRAVPPTPRLRSLRLLTPNPRHPDRPQTLWHVRRRQRHRVGRVPRPRRPHPGPRPRTAPRHRSGLRGRHAAAQTVNRGGSLYASPLANAFRLVVNFRRPPHTGRRIVTVVPPPGGHLIFSLPWWVSMMRPTMARPRPVPVALVVVKTDLKAPRRC